jgi:type I restriction enzyme S subunit
MSEAETKWPWALPEGWRWARLEDVVESVATVDPKRAFGQQEFHYIDFSAIEKGRVEKPSFLSGNDAPSRARQVTAPGDTLFSCVRVYLENIGLVGEGLVSPVASTAYCVLRPSRGVDPKYLNYFVRSRRFIQ